MKRLAVALCVVMGLVAGCGQGGRSDTVTSTSSSATTDPSAVTSTSQATTTTQSSYVVGWGASHQSSRAKMTVQKPVRDADAPYVAEQKVVWVAEVMIENTGNAVIEVNPLGFLLEDTEGFRYRALASTSRPALQMGDVVPGRSLKGFVAWETGQDAQPAAVLWDYAGWSPAIWQDGASSATTTPVAASSTSTAAVPGEPKNEAAVKARTLEYWEAFKFNDYGAAYEMLDNAFRAQMTKDEFVRRQQWLDSRETFHVQLESVELPTIRIDGDRAEVRTTLHTTVGVQSDMTRLVYEDGVWHKLFTNGDVLGVGLSFEEFVEINGG